MNRLIMLAVFCFALLPVPATFGDNPPKPAPSKPCPCKCGCADGKPCTCKVCPCKCGCADGKPCTCAKGPKIDPNPPVVPTVSLPKTRTVKPNRYFCLKAETNCASVKWIIPDGLEQLDPDIPIKEANSVVLIGDTGTYCVCCYGALGNQASDIACCKVIIGEPKPPTPPQPADPLAAAFQSAYALDKDTDRADSLAFLQHAYDGMAGVATTWTDVKTNQDAFAKLKSVVGVPGVGLTPEQVANLRKAISAELTKVFGITGTTPIDLTALATELKKIATALKGVS